MAHEIMEAQQFPFCALAQHTICSFLLPKQLPAQPAWNDPKDEILPLSKKVYCLHQWGHLRHLCRLPKL